ncbi:MAG: hypothetical protein V3V62_07380 [bacterium]
MENERSAPAGLSPGEEKFLSRIDQKYKDAPDTVGARSYLITAVVILVLFALARFIPQWHLALIAVEAAGLALFIQYKRFGRFQRRILLKLWRERGSEAA